MKCPFCGSADSRVMDSRPEGDRIRRRRECLDCSRRFTTYESIEQEPIYVKKKNGTVEIFDRTKLFESMMHACEKRQVSVEQIERATDEIICTLQNSMCRQITSREIGEMAMQKLRAIDEAAFVRFVSVYKQFKDINSFLQELEKLLREEEK